MSASKDQFGDFKSFQLSQPLRRSLVVALKQQLFNQAKQPKRTRRTAANSQKTSKTWPFSLPPQHLPSQLSQSKLLPKLELFLVEAFFFRRHGFKLPEVVVSHEASGGRLLGRLHLPSAFPSAFGQVEGQTWGNQKSQMGEAPYEAQHMQKPLIKGRREGSLEVWLDPGRVPLAIDHVRNSNTPYPPFQRTCASKISSKQHTADPQVYPLS